MHIELDITDSRIRYDAGDHVAIYPKNDAVLVNRIGELLGVDLVRCKSLKKFLLMVTHLRRGVEDLFWDLDLLVQLVHCIIFARCKHLTIWNRTLFSPWKISMKIQPRSLRSHALRHLEQHSRYNIRHIFHYTVINLPNTAFIYLYFYSIMLT